MLRTRKGNKTRQTSRDWVRPDIQDVDLHRDQEESGQVDPRDVEGWMASYVYSWRQTAEGEGLSPWRIQVSFELILYSKNLKYQHLAHFFSNTEKFHLELSGKMFIVYRNYDFGCSFLKVFNVKKYF